MNVEEGLKRYLRNNESLVCLVETDLTRSGEFGSRSFAVTSDRIMVLADRTAEIVEQEIPLREITEIRPVRS